MVFSFHSLLPLIYLVLEVPTVTETVEKELKRGDQAILSGGWNASFW